jgi:putative FmdB family regulatory protein
LKHPEARAALFWVEVQAMPMYEYHCSACKGDFEEIRRAEERDAPATCPDCGSQEVERKMSTFAVSGGLLGAAFSSSSSSASSSCAPGGFS